MPFTPFQVEDYSFQSLLDDYKTKKTGSFQDFLDFYKLKKLSKEELPKPAESPLPTSLPSETMPLEAMPSPAPEPEKEKLYPFSSAAYATQKAPDPEQLTEMGKATLKGTVGWGQFGLGKANQGFAGLCTLFDKGSEAIARFAEKSFGVPYESIKPKLFKTLANFVGPDAEKLVKMGEKNLEDTPGPIKEVVGGLASALPEFPFLMSMGLPIWGVVKGAIQEGPVGAVKGGVAGLAYGKAFQAAGVVPKAAKYPLLAGTALVTTPGGLEEKAKGAAELMAWGSMGKGSPRSVRDFAGNYPGVQKWAEKGLGEKAAMLEFPEPLGKVNVSPDLKQQLIQAINTSQKIHGKEGGSTINPKDGSLVGKPYYAVSIYPERTAKIPGKDISKEQVRKYVSDNVPLFKSDSRLSLGTWYDADSNTTYLDISVTVRSFDKALKLAQSFNQKAIFDLMKMQEVPTGGTGEAVENMPPVLERVKLMDIEKPEEAPAAVAGIKPISEAPEVEYVEIPKESPVGAIVAPEALRAKNPRPTVAIKDKDTGKVYTGFPGEIHGDVMNHYKLQADNAIPGWVTPEGKFTENMGEARGPGVAPQPDTVDLFHFTRRPQAEDTTIIDPKHMGEGQMGAESKQMLPGGKMTPGNLPKSNWYSETSPTIEPHRWVGADVYKVSIPKSELMVIPKGTGIPKGIDTIAQQEGKLGWFDEATGQARLIEPVEATRYGKSLTKKGPGVPGKDIDIVVQKTGVIPEVPKFETAAIQGPKYKQALSQPLGPGEQFEEIPTKPASKLPDFVNLRLDEPLKSLGGKGDSDSMSKGDFLKLRVEKKLPYRALKYSYENPIRVFEEHPYLKTELYDRLVDARSDQVREFRAIDKDIDAIKKTVKGNKDTEKNLAIYAYSQQKGGMEILNEMGIKTIPQLTPKEMAAYEGVRGKLDGMFTRVNAARTQLGLEPIPKIENYFTFMRNASVIEDMMHNMIFESDVQLLWRQINEPNLEFLKHRGDNKIPLETSFFDIYKNYMKKAVRYSLIAPVIAKANLILSPIKYQLGDREVTFDLAKKDPNLHSYMTKWVNYSTEKIIPSSMEATFTPVVRRIVSRINRNVAMGVLSFNVRSALIQPTSLRNAYIALGERYMYEGAKRAIDPKWTKFAEKNSRHLLTRAYDIQVEEVKRGLIQHAQRPEKNPVKRYGKAALREVGTGLTKGALAGLYPLQLLDLGAAYVTWLGFYAKATAPVAKGGKALTGKEARIYSDDWTVKTQASAALHDIAPLQRTPEGRLLTIFQTFVINEWNFMSKDVFGYRVKNMSSKERITNIARMVLGTALVNALTEKIIRVRSPFPTPEYAIYDAIKQGKTLKETAGLVLRELGESVPVMGGSIRYSTPYKKFYPAGIQIYGDILQAGQKFLDSFDFSNFKIEDYASVGRLLGLAGTGQVEKYVRRRQRGASHFEALLGIRSELAGQNKINPKQLKNDVERLMQKYGSE